LDYASEDFSYMDYLVYEAVISLVIVYHGILEVIYHESMVRLGEAPSSEEDFFV